jgi:hypothetical protein
MPSLQGCGSATKKLTGPGSSTYLSHFFRIRPAQKVPDKQICLQLVFRVPDHIRDEVPMAGSIQQGHQAMLSLKLKEKNHMPVINSGYGIEFGL